MCGYQIRPGWPATRASPRGGMPGGGLTRRSRSRQLLGGGKAQQRHADSIWLAGQLVVAAARVPRGHNHPHWPPPPLELALWVRHQLPLISAWWRGGGGRLEGGVAAVGVHMGKQSRAFIRVQGALPWQSQLSPFSPAALPWRTRLTQLVPLL